MDKCYSVPVWPASFLKEIEEASVDEGVLIFSLSCAGFAIRTHRSLLYLDPYFGVPKVVFPGAFRATAVPADPANIHRANVVIASHAHDDHCHDATLKAVIKQTDAVLVGPASAVKLMLSYGLPDDRIRKATPGSIISIGEMELSVFDGYDSDEPGAVTYLIELDGIRIFFGGDSRQGPSFDEIGDMGDVDIAILAFGHPQFYMTESQLLDTAERLKPKLLLPCHWDIWRNFTGNSLELGRLIERRKPSFEVELLLVGDSIHYLPDGRFTRRRDER